MKTVYRKVRFKAFYKIKKGISGWALGTDWRNSMGILSKTINLTPQIKLDYNIIDYRMLKWDIIILFGVKLMTIKYIYLISQPKVISMFFHITQI